MAVGMTQQGSSGEVRHPMEGAGQLAQAMVSAYAMNPNMFGGGAPTAIAPAAAMSAYNSMPASFTMPGMSPGGGG
jgi:hypothetical protein